MKNYVVGIDYGTLSARAVLLDTENGDEVAEATYIYPHGVIDECLPSGKKLPPKYALQHPADYLNALPETVPLLLEQGGIPKEQVKGVCIDFTACTVLPVDEKRVPLCMTEGMEDEPHAYAKLWKHHSAEREAKELDALARARDESWFAYYGGNVSCEWLFPKLLEIAREAPHVYQKTARFLEAADWLSEMLTGRESRSAMFAGYKALWNPETGYPSNDFFKALDPLLDGVIGTKIPETVNDNRENAGLLSAKGARLTGLCEGTPLAIPMIDGHAAMPALGTVDEGDLMIVVGTSCNQFINSRERRDIDGICGYVRDGVIHGLYTYEAGQACAGDIYEWFTKNCVPESYEVEARERGMKMHALLREKAMKLSPGESGLIALDWHNGNRCLLGNTSLSSMMLGMTLATRPEEIYRAWIEATVYGSRMIMEQFEQNGLTVNRIVAGGGIAKKDEMMMQIYADVTGKPIEIAESAQAGAKGSAIRAAVAAGIYPDLAEASRRMIRPADRVYIPDPERHELYNRLYAEYKILHDYFGRGENPVMERLCKCK
jgi:L-ribulokinase